MGFFNLLKKHDQPSDEYTVRKTYSIIREGAQFPPDDSIKRLAKYKRMRKLFEGNHRDVYERATDILKDSPQAKQLEKLYIAINLADILVTKPADLLVGEPVHFESGLDDTSEEQKALNRYVEENDLNQLLHESAMSNGYRGDAWIKVRFGYRQDYSELIARGLEIPEDAKMESVVEHVNANCVFPEFSAGNVKQIKAVNIAQVEWVETEQTEIPFLNVERHIPGHIFYTRYRLYQNGVDVSGGAPISVFNIGEEVPTSREEDHEETFLPHIPVFHIPYKSIDDSYFGIGGLEKIETTLAAINDRLVQIDYILWKHSDPTAYGPDLEGSGIRFSLAASTFRLQKTIRLRAIWFGRRSLTQRSKNLTSYSVMSFKWPRRRSGYSARRFPEIIQAAQARLTQTARRSKLASCRFFRR